MIPEQIIVATDFSLAAESAIAVAASFARRFEAKVLVINVFEDVANHRYQIPVSWIVEALRKDRKLQMCQKVRMLQQSGIQTEGIVLEDGLASTEILKTLRRFANTLLVMGTHARSGLERFMLGSTAEEVLRQATCPVVTAGPHIRPKGSGAFQRLLFATDFSNASRVAAEFVQILGRKEGTDLTVLHVSAEPTFDRFGENAAFDPLRRMLGSDKAPGAAIPQYRTLHGHDISQAIVNEAEHLDADLIILGVRRGGACTSRIRAKTAYQVIAAAPCAVLTIASDA